MITLQFKAITYSSWKTTDKQRHRLNNKPARQSWYQNGQKYYKVYCEHNQLHRLNGKPALQHWYPNGQKSCEGYYEHGEFIK